MRVKKDQACAQVDTLVLANAKENARLKRQSLSEYIADALMWQVNHDNKRLCEGKELYTGKAALYEIELDEDLKKWRKKQ